MELRRLNYWDDPKECVLRRESIIPDLIFYRYDGYNNIKVAEFVAIKETSHCYWIVQKNFVNTKPKQIYKAAERRYACLTKELALNSFRIRKKWQIIHLERQLKNAKQALYMAQKGQVDDNAIRINTEAEPLNFLE